MVVAAFLGVVPAKLLSLVITKRSEDEISEAARQVDGQTWYNKLLGRSPGGTHNTQVVE